MGIVYITRETLVDLLVEILVARKQTQQYLHQFISYQQENNYRAPIGILKVEKSIPVIEGFQTLQTSVQLSKL